VLDVHHSGFCGFVSNLQKPYLPQQFALFCWVHMSLLVVVVSSHFIVNNILEVRHHPSFWITLITCLVSKEMLTRKSRALSISQGMIWFFLPASLVVCNDIWAYICGWYHASLLD
jgi:phosphatidate cytidylyltransferase